MIPILFEAANAFIAETRAKDRQWAEIVSMANGNVVVDAGRISIFGWPERATHTRVYRLKDGHLITVDTFHP